MKSFFKGVRRHIGKLDADKLREQYELMSDEFARVEAVFESLAEGIVVLDSRGSAVRSNGAAKKLFGMEPSEMLPSLSIPLGKASRREISLTYPDARVLELQTVPAGDETLLVVRDATADRERTEEELRAGATKAVRDLAAGVAHEIGNPLNAISLNLQMLLREGGDTATVKECIHQVERLDGILKGFLQALRPSRPNLSPCSIAEPLTNCLKAMKPQFEERRIAVGVDVASALPMAAIDRAQMEQVFFNIVKNALEAMHDGGSLDIAVGSDDECVFVSIRDSGEGMPPERLARIFEPYGTTKASGTGLGLMISSRIVRDHGGSIDAESAPGEGTVFTIRLPRIERRVRALKG